jgi:hypothetical protein
MANQFASISNALAILKNFYAGPIVSQFNDNLPIWKGAEKGKEKWTGYQVVRPVKVRRNQGIGATSDGGTLPKIGQQTTAQALISSKFNYLRFGLTGPIIKASSNDKGAFVSAMEFEMEEGLKDLKSDVNRQLSWDGTSDLAVLSAAAVASPTITVTGRESAEPGNKFLDVGMVIDIVTSAGAYKAQGITINAISGTTTATLTLDQPVTAAATDIVVRSASYGQEMNGLLTTLDGGTTSIYNINRSTYPSYQGNVVNAGGGQMTLNLLQQALNEARRRGDGKITAIYSDFDSERFYSKLLLADKRYVNTMKGDGSFLDKNQSYLEFNGAGWLADKDCPQRVFMLSEGSWKKYVLAELEWADETGSYMIAQTSADQFEVRLRFFADLFCEKPSANAALVSYISP